MLKTCHDRFKSSAVATIRGDRARGVVGVAIATKPLNGHCTTLATWRIERPRHHPHILATLLLQVPCLLQCGHVGRGISQEPLHAPGRRDGRPSSVAARKAATKRKRIEKKVGDLFQHRYLFVQHVLTPAERRTLVRITRGQAELRTLRGVMDEVYRLFDRRCRSETALEKLARLRRRVRRFKRVGKTLQKLFSPNLEKALTFLDDKLLPSTSNAVERGNRRHRKMQKTVYRVRTQRHTSERIALDMEREEARRTTESDDQIAPRGSYPQGRMIPGNDAIDSPKPAFVVPHVTSLCPSSGGHSARRRRRSVENPKRSNQRTRIFTRRAPRCLGAARRALGMLRMKGFRRESRAANGPDNIARSAMSTGGIARSANKYAKRLAERD